jgi:hypothetical protein
LVGTKEIVAMKSRFNYSCITLLVLSLICIPFSVVPSTGVIATAEAGDPPAAAPPCAAPEPPLVTDLEVRQPTALSESAPGAPFRDPVFGRCLERVTDRLNDKSDPGGLKNEYSRVQSFNADETRLLVMSTRGGWYLYDARTLDPLGQLPLEIDPRWSATDPAVIYFSQETRLMSHHIDTGQTRVVHEFANDFPGWNLTSVWTRYEGSPSRDGRWWGLMAEDPDYLTSALIVYDLITDQVTATLDTRDWSADAREIDSVTISPLGNYFLVYMDKACPPGQLGTPADPCGLMVYDRNLQNGRSLLRLIGHSDTALDSQGREVLIYQDIDTDHIALLDPATGLVTPLWPIDFTFSTIGLHFSGRAFDRPGWAVLSTYDGDAASHTWMDDSVFLVELKANGRVARLAHTHSLVDENQEHDYWAEPQATANRDLSRVLFTTNWGRSGTDQVEMVQIFVPTEEVAPVFHIAPNGNDTGPGTPAQPWRTLQKAADTLVAGETVTIRAGTYRERVVPRNSGISGQPITYAAYPGETITLDGSGITVPENSGLFDLSGREYITVQGLRIANSQQAGILAGSTAHILIKNNTISNAVSSGIGIGGSNNVIASGNEVVLANVGFSLVSGRGGLLENVQLYNNLAYSNRFNGINMVQDGDPATPPMRDISLINNTIVGNGIGDWGGGIAIDGSAVVNVVARNNLVSNNRSFQIALGPGLPSDDVTVDHNLIDGFRNYQGETRGTNYLEGDPRFVNPGAADYHLRSDSPAINTGDSASLPSGIATDIDGNPRLAGGMVDIGAYEFTSGNTVDTHGGYLLTSDIWGKAVLQAAGSPVTLVWKMVGADITPSGDQVISGYFYADPADFAYGSQYNPEVFVKIYIAANGWCNIAFNHVTVDAVDVYSAHHYAGTPTQSSTVTLTQRLAEHPYSGVAIDPKLQPTGK